MSMSFCQTVKMTRAPTSFFSVIKDGPEKLETGEKGRWTYDCVSVTETRGAVGKCETSGGCAGGSGVCLFSPRTVAKVCARWCTHILERRRSAALCMMKPCIGYDFCLSDIHIHAQLPGRVCKIVAVSLTASAVPSALQHIAVQGLVFSPDLSLNGADEASWVQVSCSCSNTKTLQLCQYVP